MVKKKKNKIESGSCSIKELQGTVADLDREIFVLRNELSLHRKLEKPHLLKAKRKEKARMLTLLTLKTQSQIVDKEEA